jgi:uncharacterized protein YcbK (DUF882 family)
MRNVVTQLITTPPEVLVGPERVTVSLVDQAGQRLILELVPGAPLDPATEQAVSHFLRCRKSGRTRQMHPGLVGLLVDVARQYPGHDIEVTSAYRGTRDERRTSPHRAGRAVDFRVVGVKTTEVRDWLWATHHEVGIGWYPHSDFLHMDVRPGQKDTSWTQRHYNDDNHYNPRWAYKARKAQAQTQAPAHAP